MKTLNTNDLVTDRDRPDCDEEFSQVVLDYQKQVENLIADLFCMEEELSCSDESLEQELQQATFDQVLAKYGKHEDFIGKFCEFSQVVMKCQDKGHELRDNETLGLEEHERDHVNIQIDALLVCYEKLKILASDRLRRLQSVLEERQQLNVNRFEQWLSNIESKVCNATNIGPDYESILRQIDDMKKLGHELGNKQEFLNFMSNVIIFDEIDSESLQMQSKSYEKLDARLETMNSRWEKVCTYVQDRNDKLKRAESLWKTVNSEWPPMTKWIRRTKHSFDEISGALKNMTGNSQSDRTFVQKLIPRYDKIKADVKAKQSTYSQLESRVRADIDKFDDPCSMLVIEIEKKLEELQKSWDELKNQKRKINFTLDNLTISNLNESNCNTIQTDSQLLASSEDEECSTPNENSQNNKNNANNSIDDSLHSSGNEEKESIATVSNSISEPRAFDSSLSPDSRSNLPTTNYARKQNSSLDNSQDELSSNAQTTPVKFSSDSPREVLETGANHNSYLGIDDIQDHEEHHNCRVEEWKHSLESFMNWIKEVETTLCIADLSEDCNLDDLPTQSSWSKLDLDQQFLILNRIENSIDSKYGEELDNLIVHAQQIIEDLIPEIGDNNYEIDLKKILNDIKTRYDLVQKSLAEKRRQISDINRWTELFNTMKASCLFVVGRTGQLIPESEIGVDLITLAQQQDQLIHTKEEVRNNPTIETCTKQAKLFLKFCDILDGNLQASPIQGSKSTRQSDLDLKSSFVKLREDISNQLDILSLHLSEFYQTVDERLLHSSEVYRYLHDLNQKIQEIVPKLQVVEILRSNWIPIEGLKVEKLSEQLEDLKLYRERFDDMESSLKALISIFERIGEMNIPCSAQNVNQVLELHSTRLDIKKQVVERQKLIEDAFDNQGSPEQKYLEKTLDDMPDWVRKVAVSKVPYFLDKRTNKTSWDHPKFKKILDELVWIEDVAYSAYRVALKLRIIQQRLGLDLLMLEHLDTVLYEPSFRRITSEQNYTSDKMYYKTSYGVEEILTILRAIFLKVQGENLALDLALSMELTLNWLLNLYDPNRTGSISAMSLKVGLTVLCCATLEEKHTSMFKFALDDCPMWDVMANNGHDVMAIFRALAKIPIYLGEGEAYREDEDTLESALFECFAHDETIGVDLECYMSWIKVEEPQVVSWLTVLHRLLISEGVRHHMKCKLCNSKPIIGLRYKCLKCFNYNICQECFLRARHIDEHLPEHEMKEYCSVTNCDGTVRNLARVMGNLFKPKRLS